VVKCAGAIEVPVNFGELCLKIRRQPGSGPGPVLISRASNPFNLYG